MTDWRLILCNWYGGIDRTTMAFRREPARTWDLFESAHPRGRARARTHSLSQIATTASERGREPDR